MLILAVHQVPSLTREKYEEVVRKLTNGNPVAILPPTCRSRGCWFMPRAKAGTGSASWTFLSRRRQSSAFAKR